MADDTKLNPVEVIKAESALLRGSIPQDLADDSDEFAKPNTQLLKFHGTYQQDNRDLRGKTADGKSSKQVSMMTRTRIPGGRLTAEQMIAHLDLCDELGSSTLKCTTRQALQLHGILKKDLRETIQRIDAVQLSTLAACGDVNRNVMCCPAPLDDAVHVEMRRLTDALKDHLEPKTRAYYELWLQDDETGEKTLVAGGKPEEEEPIYGPTYLPRKFKIAVALPEDNCVDIYTNDLGFLAVVRDGAIIGYNVLVGGGLGTTPSAKKTFPALAKRMCFVTPENACRVAEAVVKTQRDHGNRGDRKTARMKYLIAEKGLEWFKAEVEKHYGESLPECTEDDVHGFDDHMGWFEQTDGKWFYGWNVENGRLFDSEDRRWKSALREICAEVKPGINLTAHQSILLTNIDAADRDQVEAIIKKHRLPLTADISTVRRWSMACVAMPTCGLAVTESERVLPSLMDELEVELSKLGLDREAFTVRMTGCPNGCARPYNADIGLVGKTKGKYTVFLGGQLLGKRLGTVYKDLVPFEEITSTLSPLFVAFKTHRDELETFGDFCNRAGNEQLAAWSEQFSAAS